MVAFVSARRFQQRTCPPAYIQRPSGLAQRRLTLHVLRATSVRARTSISAELLPPLRQTARWLLALSVLFVLV